MEHLIEKTISKKQIFDGKIIDLYVEDVQLPNGKTSKREVVKHPGAVAVIAVTNEGKIVLVRQYRKAMNRVLIEIPAGKLEKGESPVKTARRELEEETGYRCETMHHLISFYTSPGFADELVHIYIAENLSKLEETAALDEDEFVEVLEVTLDEAIKLVNEQQIYDAKTAYAIQYLQLKEAIGRKHE